MALSLGFLVELLIFYYGGLLTDAPFYFNLSYRGAYLALIVGMGGIGFYIAALIDKLVLEKKLSR